METETKGVMIAYEVIEKMNKQNVKYPAHVFTFKIPSGVTDVEMGNEDYIENFLKRVGYDDLEEFAEDKIESGEEMALYLVNKDDFIGYSLSEPFKENNKVSQMGVRVKVTDVIATESGITLTLADGTVGRRSFSKSIKDKDGNEVWFTDVQKKMRFIKNEVKENPLNYDLNNLLGRYVSYVWDKAGNNPKEFFKVMEVNDKPDGESEQTKENTANAANDLLNQLSSKSSIDISDDDMNI